MPLTLREDVYDRSADAYVNLATVGSFASVRGALSWALATEAAREAAIVRATDYLDTRYRFLNDIVGIPAGVINAASYLAVEALAGRLEVAPSGATEGASAAPIRRQTAQVGPLSETVEFDTSAQTSTAATEGTYRVFPAVEGWLREFVTNASQRTGVVFPVRF